MPYLSAIRAAMPGVGALLCAAGALAGDAACPTALPGFADPPGLACRHGGLALTPTHRSLSVELPAGPAGPRGEGQLRFRPAGGGAWRAGYPLWADPRAWRASERPFSPEVPPSWRGSLVGLTPGTAWEVEVLVEGAAGPELHCGAARTWPDAPPEGRVVDLGTVTGSDPTRPAVVIGPDLAGTPEAWTVVTGASVTGGLVNVLIDAPHVILRGLRLADAVRHGVQLGPNAEHVLIDDNEITGWGRFKPGFEAERYGENFDSGVFANRDVPARFVTVQRNRIHRPRSDANSWSQFAPGRVRPGRPLGHCGRGPDHPDGPRCHSEGPHGIAFRGNPGGHNVIRWNRIESSPDRMYNDGMGGQISGSDAGGFPGPHSDIHDNVVSHFYDDGIEVDNGGRQIRIWGNTVLAMAGDPGVLGGHAGISTSPVAIGPVFAWRNILVRDGSGRHGTGRTPGARGRPIDHFGFAVKAQEFADPMNGGLQVWVNNSFTGNPASATASGAILWTSGFFSPGPEGTTRLRPVRAYNNAVQAFGVAMADHDLPQNLSRGNAFGAPPYDAPEGSGNRVFPPRRGVDAGAFGAGWVPVSRALLDAGVAVANISDCWRGAAPDAGAVEAR